MADKENTKATQPDTTPEDGKEKAKATQPENGADKILAEAEAKAAELVAKMFEDAEAKIAEKFADAEAKIAEMFADVAKDDEEVAPVDDFIAKINAEMEEEVLVRFIKDNGRYKDDIFVQINGENMRIPRGKYVKIKKKYLTLIDQSDLQDAQTATLMHEHETAFANESKARNI